MEWIIGISTGLISWVLTGTGVLLWRKYWNPIRWLLERRSPTVWRLTRVSGRNAIELGVSTGIYNGEPNPTPDPWPTRDWPVGFSQDFEPFASGKDYYIAWIEYDARWNAHFEVLDSLDRVELRRRSILKDPAPGAGKWATWRTYP